MPQATKAHNFENFVYMDTLTASVGSPDKSNLSACLAGLSEYVFKVDESVASKGCVFRCINLWLKHVGLGKITIQEFRAGMQEVWKNCGGDIEEFEKITGAESLGDLHEV